jgi:NAD(P)H-dependent flavin oxidoreductase YrpB (nitropropane dioxygenase family)
MWPMNALTERLNLKWPVLQAPMGSASTPTLAAAVTNAGGLGGLGMWGRSAEQAARRIAGFRQQSGGSLNDPERAAGLQLRDARSRPFEVENLGRGAVRP